MGLSIISHSSEALSLGWEMNNYLLTGDTNSSKNFSLPPCNPMFLLALHFTMKNSKLYFLVMYWKTSLWFLTRSLPLRVFSVERHHHTPYCNHQCCALMWTSRGPSSSPRFMDINEYLVQDQTPPHSTHNLKKHPYWCQGYLKFEHISEITFAEID